MQFYINREAAKIFALPSRKIDKYDYLTCEEVLPSNQRQIITWAKFTYSPLGKAFENQTQKQVRTLKPNKKYELKRI